MKVLFSLIAIIGFIAAGGKLMWGDSVVAYGSYVPWGLWVALYAFMGTLAGGAAIIANLHFGFGREAYKDTARKSLIIAMITLIFAIPLIGLDLGHPLRGFRVLFMPDFDAFLPWATWSYIIFLVCSYIVIKKADANQNTALAGKLSMLFACLFLFFEAMHFGTVVSHPVWNSAVTIPLFFATAVALGFCVTALVDPEKVDKSMRSLLIVHLAMVGLMEIGKLLIELYSRTPEMAASASHTMGTPAFWLYLIFGLAIPVFLFSRQVAPNLVKIGIWSCFLGLMAAKYDFVVGAFSMTQFSELPAAFHGPGLTTQYFPAILEWVTAAGFVSAVIAVYLFLASKPRTAN